MRVYRIYCPRCGWKAPLPVDSTVAQKFREQRYCVACKQNAGKEIAWVIRETIVTGPTRYFPPKGEN